MFYIASKVLFLIFQPSSLAALALAVGLGLSVNPRHQKLSFRMMAAGLGWLVVAGFFPVGNIFLLPLEERFGPLVPTLPHEPIAGIIILGGFEDGWVSAGRGGLAVNEAAERLTEGIRLARHLPVAKVVFTGGDGEFAGGPDAAGPVREYFIDSGIAPERIIVEQNSRNTFENAIFTRDLVHPADGSRWLLVTSAFHMPRAIGVFREAGFDVIAHPVDFRTRDRRDVFRPFGSIGEGLVRADLAAKEWIGLIAYRLSGRSTSFFPCP